MENNIKAVGKDLAAVLPLNRKPWWRTPHLLSLNLKLFSAMLFSSTVGYDNSMMNGLQALETWKDFMNHPTGAYLGGIVAIQAAGSCFGYPIMSIVASKWGRKRSVYVGCAVITFGVILQTAASTPAMFIVSRFFVGAASGFFGSVPILVTETAYPTHRGKMTAGYNTLYYVGSLIAAWATFGTRNISSSWGWRIPSLLQVSIPVLVLPTFITCPESPRWLIAAGRVTEARQIFVKYHAGGDQNAALVEFEMAEVEQAIALERAANSQASYLDMFKTKGNRHRLFITFTIGIFAQWDGSGIASYYLSPVLTSVGVTSVTNQTLINGFFHLWNLIISVTAATLVDRLGRRPLLVYSSVGKLICYIIITGLAGSFARTGNSATGIAVIPMLFLFFGFYDIAWTPLVVSYPAEIWPYNLRSRGITVVACSTFGALFFNLFVNPIALASIEWKYYIVYVVILVIILVTVWLGYPETRGRSLEEMATIFDGDKAPVPNRASVLGATEKRPESLDVLKSNIEEHSEDARPIRMDGTRGGELYIMSYVSNKTFFAEYMNSLDTAST